MSDDTPPETEISQPGLTGRRQVLGTLATLGAGAALTGISGSDAHAAGDAEDGRTSTPELTFAFRVRLDFKEGPRRRFEIPAGAVRGFVPVTGGEVTGPRLEGRAVPYSGGDWPLIWPNGVVQFNAHYLLEAADGTPIYVQNRGFAHAPPEIQERLKRGEAVDPASNYFRLTPVFETEPGPHEWITRTVFVGYGEKHPTHSFFDYYAVV